MSQEDVRRLLVDRGGEASVSELADLASKKFPNRTLARYIRERLEAMEQKDIVRKNEYSSGIKWELTDKGRSTTLETTLSELGTVIDEESLTEVGVKISNIVGSLDLEREIDLNVLAENSQKINYHPEQYGRAVFKPEEESSTTILIPASGRISITGADSKEELMKSTQIFLDSLEQVGISANKTSEDILIPNIVGTFDFETEFDLAVLSIDLGPEQIEYAPEQFPGMIYRSSKNGTILIFNSGKCVIAGVTSYSELLRAIEETYVMLENTGVKLPDIL